MAPVLLRVGAALIGCGCGLFSVGTLTAAMAISADGAGSGPRARRMGRGAGDRAQGSPSRSAPCCAIWSRPLAAAGRARPGRLPRPATGYAASMAARSCCCSARWSRSGRWSGPRRPDPLPLQPLRPQRISDLKGRRPCNPQSPPASMSRCSCSTPSSCSSSCLVFYLRREDRREGYPLEDDATGRIDTPRRGDAHRDRPSRSGCRMATAPSPHPTKGREPVDIAARRTERFAGAPLYADRRSAGRRHRPGGLGRARQAPRSRHGGPSADRAAEHRDRASRSRRRIPI